MMKRSADEQCQRALDKPPLLFVFSGPSGVGKDAVLNRLKESGLPLEFIVTVTTRSRRACERDNIDYHFVSKEAFQELIASNKLLEWATVYGNSYGVPSEPVEFALAHGRDVLIKVDVQGAATIKKRKPEAILIFLAPPSMDELAQRLEQRKTEEESAFNMRCSIAEEELNQLINFDYVVVNEQGNTEKAVSEIKSIITAEKCRVANHFKKA